MLLETPKNFSDFELLDTGSGYRLERWGKVILQRPDPQIIWPRSLSDAEWDQAWAIFKSGSDEEKAAPRTGGFATGTGGRWDVKKLIPNPWIVNFNVTVNHPLPNPLPEGEGKLQTQFLLKLSPFKHTGLFAEQATQWNWMIEKLKLKNKSKKLKILNLFGYTGGATMVLAQAGCFVTHVDASKPAITWANENHRLNFGVGADTIRPLEGKIVSSPTPGVRWILDDAVKFVKRELKRGEKYDGIIMDPPAFGHSPTGKTWKFNRDLPELLADCVQLLSPEAKFLIINGYATNSSALSLNNVLEDAIQSKKGTIEFGELCLAQKSGRKISTGIFARWQS